MDGPTYKLEKVILNEDSLEDFEGPLYLILSLLGKNRIEIRHIQIAEITDQYLAFIQTMESMDMEVASEFVAMASHLIFIKTKLLLVPDDLEALSEMDKLIKCLEEHKGREKYYLIKKCAEHLAPLWERGSDLIEKPAETIKTSVNYEYRHNPEDLTAAMLHIWDRGETRKPPPSSRINEVIPRVHFPVTGKITHLLARLTGGKHISFKNIFSGSRSRSEIVATFLAILELCGKKRIRISEGKDEKISYIGEGEDRAG